MQQTKTNNLGSSIWSLYKGGPGAVIFYTIEDDIAMTTTENMLDYSLCLYNIQIILEKADATTVYKNVIDNSSVTHHLSTRASID